MHFYKMAGFNKSLKSLVAEIKLKTHARFTQWTHVKNASFRGTDVLFCPMFYWQKVWHAFKITNLILRGIA